MNSTVSNLKDQVVNPFKAITSSVQDGVALVSNTQAVITKNISAYKSSAIDGINNALKNITGGLFDLSDLGSLVTYKDGFKLNTDQLLGLAGKKLGFNISSMTDLKNQIGNGFVSELDKMTGGIASGLIIADTDGSFIKLKISDSWEYDSAMSLINFLGVNDPEGFGSVLNVAAINATLNTLLTQSIQNGLTRSLGNFKDMYVYQSDYHDALITSSNVAANNGDIETLNSIIGIVEETGAGKIAALYPNTIQQTLSNYLFSNDTDPSDYPALTAALLNVCKSLGGEDWYKYGTQFGQATNVGLVNSISDDAKILLEDTQDLIPLLCASGIFVEQSATDLFMSDFPNAVKLQ